jgi:hypothetical protein
MKVLNKLPPKHLGFRQLIIKDIRKQNIPNILRKNLPVSKIRTHRNTLPHSDKWYSSKLGNLYRYSIKTY